MALITFLALILAYLAGVLTTASVAALVAMVRNTAPEADKEP